ncbi:site-specific integrase [Butyricicoccus faecihominis]|uniref:Site-specific integrase n=1 Tax=Butyricicoccus faecihominis TaxID=1712515 RepID=A0ABQ1E0T7_9FIRM|nr:tyrosine-type recombinase/integrase [Butyricicoccus faecihominis]GFO88587.1 site-specific integrase [Butyricicoccus faecihominis]GGM68034.1 site-specific integrase [Butyricicoccus faecihominis]
MITAIQKPKRKYGEGSIYQRKDGRWVAKYKSVNMLKPCVVYAKSESEAKRKLRELKKDAAKGLVKSTSRRFGDYADQWLYTFKLHSVEDSSFDKYESAYLTHIKPAFGKMQLASIHSEQLQKLLVEKSQTLSLTVVKIIYIILSKIFSYAHSEGDLSRNPMHNVKMPKKATFKPEREIVALESDEVRAVERIAEMKNKNGRPCIMQAHALVFLVHTGLRCGEFLALKWSDIDFESRIVTVNKNLSMVYDRDKDGVRIKHKKARIKCTKTASGNRIVPLNTKAIAALNSLKAVYREMDIVSDSVAVTRKGTTLSSDQLRRVLRRVLAYAGIDKPFTLHQLRHTFATQALNAGIPITVVSKWLGHANISVTYNTYIHVLESAEAAAVELLEAI